MLNVTHYQRNADQTGNEVPSHGTFIIQVINAGEGVEKRESSYTVGGDVN